MLMFLVWRLTAIFFGAQCLSSHLPAKLRKNCDWQDADAPSTSHGAQCLRVARPSIVVPQDPNARMCLLPAPAVPQHAYAEMQHTRYC